jgi:lipopolysaccharide transport system ATP-binding protein
MYEGRGGGEKKLWFRRIFPSDGRGKIKDQFFHDEEVVFNFELGYNVPVDSHPYSVFFMVLDENKTRVFSSESAIVRSESLQLVIESNFLVRGSYSIHTFIHRPGVEQIDVAEDVCHFSIADNGSSLLIHGNYDYGRVFGRSKWKQPQFVTH